MAETIVRMGVDFRRAAIAVREHLSLSATDTAAFLNHLRPALAANGISELAVLSTCNRTELYFAASRGLAAAPWLIESLKRLRPAAGPLYDDCTRYSSEGEPVAEELFRVASGLESQILGDSQILVQVRKAWETAQWCRTAGKRLDCLFRCAVRAGKRVRSEARLSAGAAGIGAAALRTFRRLAPHNASVLILGAGDAARAAATHIAKAAPGRVSFCARTPEAAAALAREFHGQAFFWEDAAPAIRRADVVVAATAARLDLLSPSTLGDRTTPLLILDLGMPRNADPEISSLPAITLVNLDSLDHEQEGALLRRATQIPLAEEILKGEVDLWRRRMQWLKVEPAVKQWYLDAESARRELLEQLPLRSNMELLTSRMVKKVLDNPVRRLRQSILRPELLETR